MTDISFPQFWRLEAKIKGLAGPGLGRALFLACRQPPSCLDFRASSVSLSLLTRTLIPSWASTFMTSSKPNYLQITPTPYKPLFLRLGILFSGGLKDGLRHLRNSWKLSFQSAFSSDSSMRASTQSPLKRKHRRNMLARPQLPS